MPEATYQGCGNGCFLISFVKNMRLRAMGNLSGAVHCRPFAGDQFSGATRNVCRLGRRARPQCTVHQHLSSVLSVKWGSIASRIGRVETSDAWTLPPVRLECERTLTLSIVQEMYPSVRKALGMDDPWGSVMLRQSAVSEMKFAFLGKKYIFSCCFLMCKKYIFSCCFSRRIILPRSLWGLKTLSLPRSSTNNDKVQHHSWA